MPHCIATSWALCTSKILDWIGLDWIGLYECLDWMDGVGFVGWLDTDCIGLDVFGRAGLGSVDLIDWTDSLSLTS